MITYIIALTFSIILHALSLLMLVYSFSTSARTKDVGGISILIGIFFSVLAVLIAKIGGI